MDVGFDPRETILIPVYRFGRNVKTCFSHISDIVDWGYCIGCGACVSACDEQALELVHIEQLGIRPRLKPGRCLECGTCVSICPGGHLDSVAGKCAGPPDNYSEAATGPSLAIHEGHAADPEIRFKGSSGGVLSALSLYCLEVERMEFVLHTGMDPDKPWRNLTVVSRTREELLSRAGSRYTPSSPCEQLKLIENASGPCVFIGRPCDAAAAMALRKIRPQLDRNLGLVLTFFCAGAPCSKATLDLLQQHGIESRDIESIRYRGNGWPGLFSVEQPRGSLRLELTYDQTWGYLAQKFRSFRCNLCPDGLGEISDIASGDAWHRRAETSNPGESIVIARSGRGQEILRMAEAHGYLELQPSSPDRVVEAQELVKRRFEVYGRLVGLRLMGVPVPAFDGFHLSKAWTRHTTSASKFKTILGTIKRVLVRGLWHKNPLPNN